MKKKILKILNLILKKNIENNQEMNDEKIL